MGSINWADHKSPMDKLNATNRERQDKEEKKRLRLKEVMARPEWELMRLKADYNPPRSDDGEPAQTYAAGTLVLRLNREELLKHMSFTGMTSWNYELGDCWLPTPERADGEKAYPDVTSDMGDLLEPVPDGTELPLDWWVKLAFGHMWHNLYSRTDKLVPGTTKCEFGPICTCMATRQTLLNSWGAVAPCYVCEAHDPGPGKGWMMAD